MILEKQLKTLLEEISSSSPTPGGGSVSALTSSLSVALSQMVCNLTIGKKKYESAQEEVNRIKAELENISEKFIELYEADSNAFNLVMDAFKLPKSNDSEIEIRNKAIENATIEATKVPLSLIKLNHKILKEIITISEIGNQNSLSDAGVSLILLRAASEGALLNVLINTSSLSDKELALKLKNEALEFYNEIEKKVNERIILIKEKLGQ